MMLNKQQADAAWGAMTISASTDGLARIEFFVGSEKALYVEERQREIVRVWYVENNRTKRMEEFCDRNEFAAAYGLDSDVRARLKAMIESNTGSSIKMPDGRVFTVTLQS